MTDLEEIKCYSIDDLEISVRVYEALAKANIFTIDDLLNTPIREIYLIKNLGKKGRIEIQQKLKELNVDWPKEELSKKEEMFCQLKKRINEKTIKLDWVLKDGLEKAIKINLRNSLDRCVWNDWDSNKLIKELLLHYINKILEKKDRKKYWTEKKDIIFQIGTFSIQGTRLSSKVKKILIKNHINTLYQLHFTPKDWVEKFGGWAKYDTEEVVKYFKDYGLKWDY